ncbi:MAG: SAM-dependent methyltransferase [Treponema sp.]|nr:SAM-dependent methyltransferase [Treponema sp.]
MNYQSITFSKPSKEAEEKLSKAYQKIKIRKETSAAREGQYFVEMFTEKQVFHKHFTGDELEAFIKEHAGTTFKAVNMRTDEKEIVIMANKKGKITKMEKLIPKNTITLGKSKHYLLPENSPVPFLVRLGVMTENGKVISSKYDKFRQINRFLEFIDDILPFLTERLNPTKENPLKIADFGCGKSYLTFAVQYFLSTVKNIPCIIEGLDLKKDVIDYCNSLTEELGLENLHFSTGDISSYSGEKNPDLVITLHACDTATDFALKYAVEKQASAILSVPCCQHQVNTALGKKTKDEIPEVFAPLIKWGIIREKFSSLVTDAIRGQWLESKGYQVQMLEFIDEEHTPKNILIRALKKHGESECKSSLAEILSIKPEILNFSAD